MNAPIIWIGIPFFAALILGVLNRKKTLVNLSASILSLLLAIFSWIIPLDSVISVGNFSFSVESVFGILGRRLILTSGDLPFLGLIYIFGAIWFMGVGVANAHRYFAPLGLMLITLLVAARAVEPFLYAALLIEMVVLISIPIFVLPGQRLGQSVLRFLIFQTLGMPFILLSGWAAGVVEANPADQELLARAFLMFGLGFAFWLAVFPFNTWLPQLIQDTSPFVCGFVFSLLPSVGLLLMLDFINAYAWLRSYPLLYEALQLSGAIMVVTGGMWAAFEKNLARLMGYAIIVEIGFSLVALSLSTLTGLQIFSALFLSRLASLAVWSLSLTFLKNKSVMTMDDLHGMIFKMPFSSVALVMSCFSIAGLPLLAGFPFRLFLLQQIAGQSILVALWILLGSGGFMLAGLRMLAGLVDRSATHALEKSEESWFQIAYLFAGMLALIIIGLMPNSLLSVVLNILQAFERLL